MFPTLVSTLLKAFRVGNLGLCNRPSQLDQELIEASLVQLVRL